MPIPVTCPSCFTRFNVSDKFAGKSGPCPKCQKTIKIPEKSEEVVIHAPEDSGPKDSKGQSVLKPLRRKEVSLSMPVLLAAGLGTLVVFGVALGLGVSGDPPPTVLLALSSIVLAIPIVIVGYWFLHDDELAGYTGQELLVRAGICALGFAASWGVYAFVPAYIKGYDSMAEISGVEMAMFVAIMIAMGTIVSVLSMELEVLQGLMHYMLYFSLTFTLTWLAGTQLADPLSRPSDVGSTPRPAVAPDQSGTPAPILPPNTAPPKKPNLLQ
ncbi:MAG: hypothetical protein R3C53_23660 [Pirellulaceae bacterium]